MSSALEQYIRTHIQGPVKLHLGCGGVRWKDFVNVDLHPAVEGQNDTSRSGCIADVFADIRRLDIPDETVDEIFCSHTVEHFTRWVALEMFDSWRKALRPGGKMVVEMPDFWRCVLWLFHPLPKKRRVARAQFYGNQWDRLDFETHRYLWTASEIRRELRDMGFSQVRVSHRTETHYPGRDMRVEAVR